MTDIDAAQPRRVLARAVVAAVLAVVLAFALLLAALYLGRRQLAREAVTGWLRSRGVVSESQFVELGPGRLVGRIRIGAANAPDLIVDRAEVTYSLSGLIAGKGVQVTSVRLVRPVLRARWQAGRFSAGGLDPLIAELRKRPPKPGGPSPRIEVEQGLLLLATDYGPLRASANARIDNGRLTSLDASTAPTRLAFGGVSADLGIGTVEAHLAGEQMVANLRAPFARLAAPGGELRDGTLSLAIQGGYPDPAKALAASGQVMADLQAASVQAGAAKTADLHLTAASRTLTWTRAGGDRLAGDLHLAGEAHAVAAADLRLASAAGDFTGQVSLGPTTSLTLDGDAEGRGAWTGLGPPTKGDSAEIVAVKRGLRAFRVSAQGLGLTAADGKVRGRFTGPARLLPEGGGEVRVVPAGGGFRLTAAGGGLPRVDARATRVVLTRGGAVATGAVRAALSIGPLQQATFDAAGALSLGGGQARFTANRCAAVTAVKLDLGQNDAEGLSSRICPAGGPLLSVGGGGWAIHGRAEQAAARVPFLQASLAKGAGELRFGETGGALSARLQIASTEVRDAAPKERFRPLTISGDIGLAHDLWRGDLDIRLPKGGRIAHAMLRHDGRSGAGSVEVATDDLAFAPGGLQPADVSPLAAPLGTAVAGTAAFAGGFRWTPQGATSGGVLTLPGIDFKSPAGQVSGLTGAIRFTSLAPLIAPAGQTLKVRKIAAALPLTDVTASFALQEKALVISGGQASAGGGKVRIASLTVPLETGQPIKGAIDVDGVQLHDLVEASPFGDRVDLDARVSGRIPFEAQGQKVRVAGGDLHAIAPGRLSISRTALSSVSAQGSVKAPAAAAQVVQSSDTFTDFAYQALENLAFDKLDAGLNTRADGRLGVMFHIVGRHDPPKHQEITISLWDLLRKKFLGKPLPLPSGTGVDLTLDTTLNLDDLLKDYADFERLRSSPPVQR